MTREDYVESATTFKPLGLNCAQSVIKALESFVGDDAQSLIKAASGFGAGMGCMEATCGALVGAGMVAGSIVGGHNAMMKSKEIFQEFKAQCGATRCRDLKGVDTGVVLCSCPDCIKNATGIAIDKLQLL